MTRSLRTFLRLGAVGAMLAVTLQAPAQALPGCGTWRVVLPPPPPRFVDLALDEVSATSPSDVWAAGWNFGGSPPSLPMMHWDGSAWSYVPTHSPRYTAFYALTALAPDDVWAGGVTDGSEPFIEHWDGSAWAQVPAQGEGSYFFLYGMSGSSATDVWAAGWYYTPEDRLNGLGMHWDGTAWSFLPGVLPEFGGVFEDVVDLAPDDVWAVGYQGSKFGTTNETPLIEHWDGTAWSIVPGADVPGTDTRLFAVSALGPDNIWAAGQIGKTGRTEPLVEHWDGVVWTQVPTPQFPGSFNELLGVTALAEDDVWAVGSHTPESVSQPLALHWDGTAWDRVTVHAPTSNANLNHIAQIPEGGLWTVGSYVDQMVQPLTEHLTPCP